MGQGSDRRGFLKSSAVAGLGMMIAGRDAGAVGSPVPVPGPVPRDAPPEPYRAPTGFAAPPVDPVRIGFVGVGLQGGSHVKNFLGIDRVEIKAVCDVDEARAGEVAEWVVADGRPKPDLYTRGDTDYKRLCERDDIDLIFNSTPWRWHVPVCVEAMETGKHTAVEVPAAYTIDGCWELVETAERTLRHCVMMENCNYGRGELLVLRMVRAGLLGELLHAEGAYIHDLRAIKFSDANEGLWRLDHSVTRNGNLYPTHGLGPVANCLDINRGDCFTRLVSMSSPARGLELWAEKHLDPDDPRAGRSYALGDMNSSLIQTALGRTILVQHDTASPRPYSRLNLVQGTKGTFAGFPDRIYVEGDAEGHSWQEVDSYRETYDHPLWRELEEKAAGAGHGGMDYLEDYRLVERLLNGQPMDMDVYDAAALSVVTELSEISVAQGSAPVDFPDFTRGLWQERSPSAIAD